MEETRNEASEILEQGVEENYKIGSVQYMDSRKVAEIVEKEHSKLLRDIERYSKELNQANFGSVDFFIKSEYTDKKGERRPCCLVTKKGN